MYNKIILIGNLTKDPELRYSPQGMPVATMRIAVNSKVKQGDEFKDDTLFIDVISFSRQAETVAQYLSKGSSVLVEGRLRERKWEYEGQQRSKFEVIANTVRFLPKRGSTSEIKDSSEDIVPPEETTELEPF